MKSYRIIVAMVIAFVPYSAALAQCPPPMVGEMRVLVKYSPGPNWSKFGEFVKGHLDFISAQMKSGIIASAGPSVDDNGEFAGGFSKYALSSRKDVEALARQDPFVTNSVVEIESNTWLECHLEK